MAERIWNFAAGPAVLPEPVLRQAQDDLWSLGETGIGVMEHSHRGKAYCAILAQTEQALRDGIVSRGVLLDVPRARGLDWLEASDPIFPDDLEKAESDAGLRVEEGDVLFIRTGRWALRDAHGPWSPTEKLAGLDASCLPWLHERGVAALGCDGVSDVLPSRVEGVGMPIHTVAIVAMGLHLLDNLELEDLATACAEEERWTFLLTVAPLVLRRGTASPVNPVAVF